MNTEIHFPAPIAIEYQSCPDEQVAETMAERRAESIRLVLTRTRRVQVAMSKGRWKQETEEVRKEEIVTILRMECAVKATWRWVEGPVPSSSSALRGEDSEKEEEEEEDDRCNASCTAQSIFAKADASIGSSRR